MQAVTPSGAPFNGYRRQMKKKPTGKSMKSILMAFPGPTMGQSKGKTGHGLMATSMTNIRTAIKR